jgi:hypothetical protein
MDNSIQNTSADGNLSVDSPRGLLVSQSTTATPQREQFPAAISDDDSGSTNDSPKTVKQFQPLRFAVGLCCTSSGVALILGVGLRVVEMHDVSNYFAMPLVAVCILAGVMLLGGGFGVMATSSSGFDEAEFDRLATAGNISAARQSDHGDENTAENQDSQQSAA